jgi:effector-binding domain-containing protein
MEIRMSPRLALGIGVAVLAFAVGAPHLATSQTLAQTSAQPPAQTQPAPAGKSDAKPDTKPDTPPAAQPPAQAPAASVQPTDPFGEDATLTAKPIVFLKGTGTWDSAFETITTSFKTLKAYVTKEGLKVDGQPMTVFTSTDDTGFSFQAAIPIVDAPKTPPRGEIGVGNSPEGHALKFVHRGSYDGLDNTYEAITNYLDEHKLEAKDMFIEQYVTDPLTTSEEHLVVNVYVLVK